MNKTVVFFLFLFIVFIKFVFSENDQFRVNSFSDTAKTVPLEDSTSIFPTDTTAIQQIDSITEAKTIMQSEQYLINTFNDTVKSIGATGNEFIRPVTKTTLQQITSVPETLEKGQVLLRRRFSANEYGLYLGIMNPKAYSRLSAFKPPHKMAISTFVKRKLYDKKTDNPDSDIRNVYFDGDLIYVENVATVYFHDSSWNEMKMLDILPSRLHITTEPIGAAVFMNGDYQGVTPLYLGAQFEPSVVVRLDLKGYLNTEPFIYLESGTLIEKHFKLMKKPDFGDSIEIDIGKFTAENTESVLEVEQRIATLQQRAEFIEKDSSRFLREFIHNYEPIRPKDQFETTEEFKERKKVYDSTFTAKKVEHSRKYHEKRIRILNVIPQMEAYLESIKEREYTKYFNGDLLKLSPYNADSGYFPVLMSVNEKGFYFNFKGKLYIPRDEARDFFAKGTGSGKIILTYKNWQISIPNDSITESYYIYYTAFNLRFKEVNYELRGKWAFPDFIEKSSEYADYLDAKEGKKKARGKLVIETKPKSAKTSIYLNDSLYAKTSLDLKMRPGFYKLALKAAGYKPVFEDISVLKDTTIFKSFIMQHTPAFLDSVTKHKQHFSRKFQIFRRITFLSSAVITGGLGYFFEMEAKKNYDNYQNLNAHSPPIEFDNKWNNFKSSTKYRNICYVVSGLSLGLFALSIPF